MAGTGLLRPSSLVYSGIASPRSFKGLAGWYDFSLSAGLFEDVKRKKSITKSGQLIGGAADLSGAGNHFIQDTFNDRPRYCLDVWNGSGAASFDGGGTMLTHEGINGVLTAAVVYKHFGKSKFRDAQLFASNEPGVWHEALVSGLDAQNQLVLGGAVRSGRAQPDTAWHINLYLVTLDPAQVIVRMDREIDLVYAFADVPVIGDITSIGGSLVVPKRSLKGYIGEVVFYERALSLAACARLERWLAYKWEIGMG